MDVSPNGTEVKNTRKVSVEEFIEVLCLLAATFAIGYFGWPYVNRIAFKQKEATLINNYKAFIGKSLLSLPRDNTVPTLKGDISLAEKVYEKYTNELQSAIDSFDPFYPPGVNASLSQSAANTKTNIQSFQILMNKLIEKYKERRNSLVPSASEASINEINENIKRVTNDLQKNMSELETKAEALGLSISD